MKALIFGISGQDGALLARHLLERGYEVVGTSRDAQVSSFGNLVKLGVRDRVRMASAAINDFRSVLQLLARVEADEIYNLAGQTSVGLSFEQPVETLESIAVGTLNILEALRFLGKPAKFYNAASSECFGESGEHPADEETPFRPRSPYAVAKATAFWEVANYREAYGLFACSGILFNHESALRPERFVTQKIVAGACRIAAEGGQGKLHLGNLGVERDWGWAGGIRGRHVADAPAGPGGGLRDRHGREPCRWQTSWRRRSRAWGWTGASTSSATRRCCVRRICRKAGAIRPRRSVTWVGPPQPQDGRRTGTDESKPSDGARLQERQAGWWCA